METVKLVALVLLEIDGTGVIKTEMVAAIIQIYSNMVVIFAKVVVLLVNVNLKVVTIV